MSDIMEVEPCTQCGYERALFDLSGDGECSVHCPLCGFMSWETLVTGEESEPPGHTPKLRQLGKWVFRQYEQKGCGALQIKHRDGRGTLYCASEPFSEDEVKEFLDRIASDPGINPDKCYMTEWDEKLKVVRLLAGKRPYGCHRAKATESSDQSAKEVSDLSEPEPQP